MWCDIDFDEETNEIKSEKDIEMNIKEINEMSNIKNKNDDNKLNLPLTLEKQNNLDYIKKENNENFKFENSNFSLYKEFEEKWNKIERNKINTLKKKKDSYKNNNSKSNISTFYSLSAFQNWKEIINECRKKFNERKLKDNENEFEIYVKDKMKKIKSITNYNSYNNNQRYRNRISNYNKDNNYNNILFNESYYDNNIAQNSFLKNDIDKNRNSDKNLFNKINYFRKNYEKITIKNKIENKLKNKIKNVFEIISKNRENITDRGNNKFVELSMNELDTNFDEIMRDFSKDYREKNQIFIRKKLNEQNLNNNNYDNDSSWNLYSIFSNYEKNKINKNIELKIKENRKLLNNILLKRKNGDLKKLNSNLRSYNKNLSNSNSSLTGRKKTKTPIRVSSIYKVNNFKETSNKLIRYNTPAISKLLYF